MRLAVCSASVLLALFALGTSGTPVGAKPLDARQGGTPCAELLLKLLHHADGIAKNIEQLRDAYDHHPSDQLAAAIARAEVRYQQAVNAAVVQYCSECGC